jgi:hypothetical protein
MRASAKFAVAVAAAALVALSVPTVAAAGPYIESVETVRFFDATGQPRYRASATFKATGWSPPVLIAVWTRHMIKLTASAPLRVDDSKPTIEHWPPIHGARRTLTEIGAGQPEPREDLTFVCVQSFALILRGAEVITWKAGPLRPWPCTPLPTE